jgi:hypothetical protein
MKVYIGPYINFIGPYQIADLLQYVGVSEARRFKIGTWLSKTWLDDVCEWIHAKRNRKVKIKLHKYDTWSVDATLGQVILALLKQYREHMRGAPYTQDADVPEELRSTACAPAKEYEIDANHFRRWEWVVDEMIWAFEQTTDPDSDDKFLKTSEELANVNDREATLPVVKIDHAGLKKHAERIQRGTTLFGKYYQGLWN